MKVSNNALNFILAQYRAIFKRAYVKGLASAVLLTAGLAVGQAQAAGALTDTEVKADPGALATADQEILIGVDAGEKRVDYSAITISGTAGGTTAEWNANVTLNSGEAGTANYIKGKNGSVTLTGSGSLTIDMANDNAEHGLAISGGTNGATVSIGSIKVATGTLAISDSTGGDAKVSAGEIKIGSATPAANPTTRATAPTYTGKLTLSSAVKDKKATLGDAESVILIDNTGKLEVIAGSGSASISGASLTLNKDALFLTKRTGDKADITTTLAVDQLTALEGSFHIVSGTDTKTFTQEFTGKTASFGGNLLITEDATLDLKTKLAPATGGIEGQGVVTLEGTSNTVLGGTLKVSSGTLVVASGAQINASVAKATIAIAETSASKSTLEISSSTLMNFLSGGNSYQAIDINGTTDKASAPSEKGAVTISSGTLHFTDDNVTLSNFGFKATNDVDSNSEAGKITFNSGSVTNIVGKNFTIEKQLSTKDGAGSKIQLKANSLTLGGSSVADYGFKSATVANLYETATGTVELGNAVTLDVTLGDQVVVDGTSGVLSGDFILTDADKSITVAHGTFTQEGSLTISGGSLTVQNEKFTEPNAQNIDTKLTLSNLTLKADGSKITVDGKNNDKATILDLSEISKSEFNVSGGTNSGSITVQSGGTLIATGEQVRAILDAEGTKGFAVKVDKGTLEVEGNLTLDATNELASDASTFDDNKITFHKTNGGTLSVDGKLTLKKASTVKLAHAKIAAETLVLNTATSGTAVTLSGGKFTAWAGLEGDAGIEVSGSTSMFLGGFDYNNEGVITGVKSNSGNIKTDLIVNGGNLTVQNGSWNGQSQTVSVSGGNFIVGDADKVDANNNTFATSLSLNKLSQTGGTTKIDTVGSLKTKSLEVTTGATSLQVDGAMTVDGDYKEAVPDVGGAAGTPASYGVELAAGKLKVGANATLTFGADATKAIKVNDTEDTSGDGWISIVDGTFGAGDNTKSEVIGVGVGSTVTFGFESGTSFSSGALAEFRKEIFGLESGNLAGFVNLGDAQIAGLTDAIKNNEIAYDDLQGYIDVNSDFTTEALQSVKVTDIDSSSELRGSLGSLSSTELSAGDQIAVDGNLALNNAAANGDKFAANDVGEVLGLNVTANANVTLNNGGEIGTVSFSNNGGSFVVASENGTTKIAAIDGEYATTQFNAGTATVTGATETAQLTTAAGTNTTFVGNVTVGQRAKDGTTSSLAGDATFQGAAIFYQNAEVAHTGSATFAKDVTFEGNAAFYGDTTVEGTATAKHGLTVDQGAVVALNKLITSGDVFVGSVEGEKAGAGTLSVTTLNLGGKNLVVDPAWDNATGLSFAGVDKFTTDNTVHTDAGVLNGGAYALQNAILSIGNSNKDEVVSIFGKFINAQGNLSNDKDGVGAIVYVADTVEVATGGKIVADKTKTESTFKPADYTTALFIGDNSVLGVEVSAATSTDASGAPKAAITFADDVTVDASNSGKIVLTGDYDQSDRIYLMADQNGTGTVTVADNGSIKVETINGLLTFNYTGQTFNINEMTVDTKRAASAFSATSSPVHESLVAYGTGNTDWRNANKQNPDQKLAAKTHGAAVSGVIASIDNNGNVTYYREPSAEGETPVEITDTDETKYYTVVNVLNPEYKEGVQGSQQYLPKVFLKADNALLSAINNVQANSGISAESAARMADFAGVAQVALKAGNSTSDAISGRMGMGAQNSAITYANNGQGAGLWVTPIYMNSDSDGFEAQGISYGTDINLYGVALGGDYTLANGIRVGAMFNVGSGDVDGQGAGSNVSSDFDYYGFGLYAGYTMGQFSIVGDVSYTAVDNDVEANTEFADIGKLETSLDSSNISFGVTGAYAFDTAAGVQVTPHVGLRYSYIDIDDYTVGSKKGAIGSYSADSLSVFSIPVGVTIASEFNAGSWSVKPSFDLTLTGNFGDDENEGTFHWDGVENIDSGLTSEIFDNFTYGATLGVAAQSASGISLGLSVGYTGSSNVDDFGVNANARFTF